MIKHNSHVAAKPYAAEKDDYLQPAVEAVILAHQQVLMSSGEDLDDEQDDVNPF